ncbi:MAG TPA: peptidoglycan-binding domain-containing protein [Chthoniobacterales bacterium]|nr:peptidoglycan-binding domain-containing protein [Chthoniobacterales bacterium]
MKRKLIATTLFFLVVCCLARADQVVESVQQKLKDQGFYYGEITGKKDTDTTAAIRRYQIRNGLQITGEINAETQRSLGLASKPAATPPPRPANTPAPKTEDPREEPPEPPSSRTVPRPPPDDLEDEADEEEDEDTPDYEPAPRGPRLEGGGLLDGTPFEAAPPHVQRDVIVSAQTALMRQGYYRDEIDGAYGPEMNFALRNYQARYGLRPTGRLDVETLASLSLLPEQRRRVYRRPFHRRMFRPY